MRKDIEQRWLEQVQRDIAKVPDIELTQLRDGIPDYLAALEQLLSRSGASKSDEATGGSIWAEVAREHGITRVQIGFDISQLIHEFLVLRRIIRDVAGENGVALAEADIVLTELIDAAIVEAVQAYVDARDYQTRRTQAENIAFVTHELRNPLTTASQAAVLLRHQATPEQRQALDALERSHRRLGELVDSVLAVQKLDAGKLECHLEEVALGPVIDSTVAAASPSASGSNSV